MPFVAHRVFGWAPTLIDTTWGIQTVPTGMAYTICLSLQCEDCGLLFSDLRFTNDELQRLYIGYRDQAYTALREQYEPGYASRNEALSQQINYGNIVEDFLEPLLPTGSISILDWGGDSGKNTPLRERASTHHVYDISQTPVVPGAKAVTQVQTMQGHYDLIVCSNVLEHVPYPSDLLYAIQLAMRPDSLLYIEVPFEDVVRNHDRKALPHKRHWHEHINFFTLDAVGVLLANCGLNVVALSCEAQITAGLKSSYLIQAACRFNSPPKSFSPSQA